jgi:predicted O-methyltransferase YrrM
MSSKASIPSAATPREITTVVGAPSESHTNYPRVAVLSNALRFIIAKPSRVLELFRKIAGNIFPDARDKATDLEWIKKHQENFETWARQIDAKAWDESVSFSHQLEADAKSKLAFVPFALGGGGIYPILYFITLTRKPRTIVETGVAAGYSSQTFLAALKKNGTGKLFSSDFPYFRLPNPEKYIGILVNEDLKKDWILLLEGDRKNLRRIGEQVEQIDFFHHDSDKTYRGRSSALALVRKKLSPTSYVMFDDIHANNYFRDLVQKLGCEFRVFQFEGKFVGLISGSDLQR